MDGGRGHVGNDTGAARRTAGADGGQRELGSLRLAGLLAATAADRCPQVLGQVLQRG
jgi:hypothetical protein